MKGNMKKEGTFDDHISESGVFFSIVHMDDQRTGISDCVSVVVAHGTGSKNLKVGTDSSQF